MTPAEPPLHEWWGGLLRSVLDRRDADRPVLVALDDLQWADRTTLDAVQALAVPRGAVVWLLARCTGGAGGLELFDLLERQGAERRSLGPLDDTAVAEIAADLLGAPPDSRLLAFAAEAGGDPLLLTELLTGLRDEGAVRISGGRARLSSARLPERVRAGVARRLRGLGPRTRRLLTASAVLGPSFWPGDVAELLGTTPAALLPGLEELLDAGVLTATPKALRFRHELTRRVVLEQAAAGHMGPQATADLAMTAASELTGPDLDGRQPAVQAGAGLPDPDASTRRRNIATSRDTAPAPYDDTDAPTPRRNTTTSRQRAKTAHDPAPAAYDATDTSTPRRNTTTSRQRAKTAHDPAPAAYDDTDAPAPHGRASTATKHHRLPPARRDRP